MAQKAWQSESRILSWADTEDGRGLWNRRRRLPVYLRCLPEGKRGNPNGLRLADGRHSPNRPTMVEWTAPDPALGGSAPKMKSPPTVFLLSGAFVVWETGGKPDSYSSLSLYIRRASVEPYSLKTSFQSTPRMSGIITRTTSRVLLFLSAQPSR